MSDRTAAVAVAFLAALSVVTLAGCTDQTPEVAETTAAVAPTANSSAQPAPSAAAATAVECKRPGGDGTISRGELLDVGLYAGMVDMGPREGANGTVSYAPDGTLASYVVAADDFEEAIIGRLCVGPYSFDALNAVRRGSLLSDEPTDQAYLTPLYVGDTLNLSPYTIASVGDVNGEVRSYEPSFVLPPQR